jgi:hypothetical protein
MAKHLPQLKSSLPSIQEGLSKRQITALANELVETVLEEGNAIQIAEAMAAMEEFVQRVRKDERFVDFLRDELLKHNGRMLTASGAKIEVCEAGVSYDYSQDPGWSNVDAQIKELTQQKKAIEETLRKLAPGRMAVDPETGEVLEGPTRKSKSTYRITLAKS